MSTSWPPNVRPLPVASADSAGTNTASDAGTVADLSPEIHRCQLRITLRLAAAEHGRLLHVPGLGWHWWDGCRWAVDPGDRVAKQAVIRTVHHARLQASSMRSAQDREDLWRDAKSCETAAGVRGVLELGAALPDLSALSTQLDVDPHLLNTPAGTLDLSTGRTHQCSPDDLLTKVTGCPHQPGAISAQWDAFLAATLPDVGVRAFLQRVVGLALVGKVIEHVLPILTGTGRNGKGTFVRTVAAALGSYAIEAEPDMFMARERAHPTGQLDLRGVRLATCQETDDGRRLDVAAVKRLTGGDTIRARRMRQDFIEFAPSHLPFLITNHLPKVPADDLALWARLLVIPFDQSFLGREDRGLEDRLRDGLPAVLAWAVAGWDDYRQRGRLDPPAAVSEGDVDLPGQQRRRRRVHRRRLPAQPAHARRLGRPVERMGDLVSRELGAPREQPHTQGGYGVARGLSLPIQRPVPIPGHRPGQRAGLTVDLWTNQCSKCSNTPST